ncbi:MAG: hypothetical protein Q9167_005348 [Letrouitia subvulpina]
MSDPNNPNIEKRYYASSNAGQSYTHLANSQAFYRHRIIPKQLVDTNLRDSSSTIFGHKVSAPIGFAPIGINKIYNPAGEIPVARVAKELNLPYCLSTAGSSSVEDVAAANGQGPRFYQLYMPYDDELTVSLLTRASKNGFDGIQSIDDAKRVVEAGCDGIVVSNHAGRQVDGAIASLDALENIVAAVGDKIYIMYDSGVRGGSDIAKALALEAKFVWVGRLWVWGLSIMGESGVRHVMKSLLVDFDILMNVSGFQNIEQIDRSAIGKMLVVPIIKIGELKSGARILS